MNNSTTVRRCSLLVCAFVLGNSWVLAETVLVESRTTNAAPNDITSNPPYQEVAPSWSSSGSKSTAIGTTTNRIGSRFGFSGTPSVTIKPTLIAGASYRVDTTHISINASPNIIVNVGYVGCTGTAATTDKFNSSVANVWATIGEITVDAGVTQPEITFTYASGTLASTGGRWYVDAFRFVNLAEPCVTALPELTTVNGPLGAGQTFVNVPGVNAAATAVSVYANGVLIGRKTSGITNGVNKVTVSPLVKGQIITVTQSNASDVESCRPSEGTPVGGGANPSVRVALSIRQNTGLTGPIGANGGNSNTVIKYLGATNTVIIGNLSTAPAGTKVINPGNDWQTVTWLRGPDPANPTDPTFLWNGTDTPNPNQLKGDFGVLDSIDFAMDNGDNGPYAIYIDTLQNGSTAIQDFENANVGTVTVGFNQPSLSGTTSPYLLSPSPGDISPNLSVVSNNTSAVGVQSLFVSWQFKDTAAVDWLRFVAQGSGTPNPQLDLRLPISLRILLLPVGQSPPPEPPEILSDPQNLSVLEGASGTFTFGFRAAGPVTYQWRFNGSPISGATNRTLTLTNIQSSQAGNYSVTVSNSLNSATSGNAVLTVSPVPHSTVLTPLWQLAPGSRPYLTTDNNQNGIAYDPVSGHLLLLSRAPTNAIYVLDGDTGAFLHNMMPTNVALNMIGVADDGLVFAGSLTMDGTVEHFKLYGWADDNPDSAPFLAWEGDPGSGTPDRWGDTMAVRGSGFSEAHILLGSRSGTAVAVIDYVPDFANSVRIDVTGAAPGNFGWGLCWGQGDTIWGKGDSGIPLSHAAVNLNTSSGNVLESYSSAPNLRAIGVNPSAKLLAGVSVETPDNLRLYDISDLNAGPMNIDTEFFPTDNANNNGGGAVAFGPSRVWALDSNNGLIAMVLNTACIPAKLTITRSGTDVVLSWTRPDSRLQGADAIGVPDAPTMWNNLGSTSPVTLPATGGMKFFRLTCP